MDLTQNKPGKPHDFAGHPGQRLAPATPEEAAQLLHAHDGPVACTETEARDLAEPAWMDLTQLNQVRRYRVEDLTIEVETGITWGELRQALSAEGHTFPLRYPDDTRLCDILAEDRAALETGLAGYPRDYVLKSEVVTADGQITHYGADVVKNATGYDLNKLYVGSHNTLAVPTAVTLKLMGAPHSRRSFLFGYDNLPQALQAAQVFLQAGLPLSLCELFTRDRLNTETFSLPEGAWQVWTELSGEERLVTAAAVELQQLSGKEAQPLNNSQSQALLNQLGQQAPDRLTVEAAVPVGALSNLLAHCANASLQLAQVRPAAGLCLLQPGPNTNVSDWEGALADLQADLSPQGGVLKLSQVPPNERRLAERFNLPDNPILRRLSRQLKDRYDPTHKLYSRLLPVELA